MVVWLILQVYAQHQDVNLEHYLHVKRVILKDVLRTDRFLDYFKWVVLIGYNTSYLLVFVCRDDRNLRKVHVILMIYAMFHPGEYVNQLLLYCYGTFL